MLFFWGNQYNLLPNMEFLSFRAVCVSTAILEKNKSKHFSPYKSLHFEGYISRLAHLWFMKSQLKTFDLIVFTLVFTIVR